jgi:hypothetical protein
MPAAATSSATHPTSPGRHRSTHIPPNGWDAAFAPANTAKVNATTVGFAPARSSRSGTNGMSSV